MQFTQLKFYNNCKSYSRLIAKTLYQSAVNTINHDGVEHAGYMAFLSLLSLFPFLVFIAALAGFFGESNIGTRIVQFILTNLPANVSNVLEPRVKEIILGPPQGIMTFAIVGAIWTASSSVEGLRTILNRAYNVSSPPPYVFRRLLSIIQFLFLTFILVVTVLILIIVPIFWEKLLSFSQFNKHFSYTLVLTPIWEYVRYLLIGVNLFVVVATLYFVLPNARLNKIDVWPGAILVVLLWSINGALLSFYIQHFQQLNLIYGSLVGIVFTLIFFYLINLILIFGAEFNSLFGKTLDLNKKCNV